MVLPECNLFPHCLLPLCIFEPRYVEMLQQVLQGERMFCVGMRHREAKTHAPPDIFDVYPYATAGIIRACVRQCDGTFRLLLQGIIRVKFVDWTQLTPYRIARIRPVEPDLITDTETIDLLQQTVKDQVTQLANKYNLSKAPLQYLCESCDPDVTADVVAFHFVRDPLMQQHLLGITDVKYRLETILGWIQMVMHGDGCP